ncbi:glucosamine-6-phosphate deaminase [Glutamicibacter uratoxydans]|uniref:Glucosamine-6-phosphate deaminase n=1 Tax=Glutamicibacter uratoxydans TaxID=43667 RepID=A0A4Y4DWA3_GLUUR|nr:glucosamine-6-phosphate deaminase [Glutamicibacter uratoxydans]GED06681.1 glucosamine-6-phosphate deaminase [Glutamicibacter uratoxydans]
MRVLIGSSPEEVARIAADNVLAGLAEHGNGAQQVLGLATGSSPLGLYRELAVAAAQGRADFSSTLGFALDEYIGIPDTHEQSYRQTLVNEVCNVIGLPVSGLNVPKGTGSTVAEVQASADAYDAAIKAAGGIQVQILGIGANGHLGFNEPGSALTSRTRIKRLASKTRQDNARFFDGIEHVPTHCVTQGLGTILEAGRLVLVATGAGKADAIAAAVEGALSASCPGSVLQLHRDAVVVLDEAAASKLAQREYYDDAAAGITDENLVVG